MSNNDPVEDCGKAQESGMKIELSKEEHEALSQENKDLYKFAMEHINDDWAMGPYGGWARAHEALKKIGYTEKTIRDGCREYVSLVKP